MKEAPLIGISRLRMGTDGRGVTTLVAFHGCPLHCTYCLNKQCHDPKGIKYVLSPEELYNKVKKDAFYFKATNGGITFGGGEPLLYSEFIRDVLELGAKKWHTTIETSLNVPQNKLEVLLPYINHYIVDIKDMDLQVYESYTHQDNLNVLDNLRFLSEQGKCDDVTVRVPHIPDYNKNINIEKSIQRLREMGFSKFDIFKYHRFTKNTFVNWLEERKERKRKKLEKISRTPGFIAR